MKSIQIWPKKIEQGITTSIAGQCGGSIATKEFPKDVALGSNNALLAGHGTIRKAMDDGALDISFGPIYAPGCYADTEELIKMAKSQERYLNKPKTPCLTARSFLLSCMFCSRNDFILQSFI